MHAIQYSCTAHHAEHPSPRMMQVILTWINRAIRQLTRPWAMATVPSIDVQARLNHGSACCKLRELISPHWQSSPPRRLSSWTAPVGHPSVALEADSVNEITSGFHDGMHDSRGMNGRGTATADARRRRPFSFLRETSRVGGHSPVRLQPAARLAS